MLPVCGGGFCWVNPLPVGIDLRAAKTSPSGASWVVGDNGTVLEWNGATWRGWFALANLRLYAVWPFSDTDVWAAGVGGTILHFDGATWTPVSSGTTQTLRGMWGASDGTLWVVGGAGTVLKRAPAGSFVAQTTVGTTANLNAAFGIGPDLWLVGSYVIARFNGTTWSTTSANWDMTDVWGGSASDIWAVSGSGVMRFTGTAWANSSLAVGYAIIGFSTTQVWVTTRSSAIYKFDGLTWTNTPAEPTTGYTSTIYGLTGRASDGSVLAVGARGAMFRNDGLAWYRVDKGVQPNTPARSMNTSDLYASPGSVALAGVAYLGAGGYQGTIIRCSAGTGCTSTSSGSSESVTDVGGSGSNNLWAIDYYRALSSTGGAFTPSPTLPANFHPLGVAPISASDVWTVGGDKTVHFNGTAWAAVANPVSATATTLSSVVATATNQVWAGGSSGTLLRYDGATWTAVTSGTGLTIAFLKAFSPTAVFAGGDFGVFGWNGTSWAPTSETTAIAGLWPESSTAFWVVQSGIAKRWNGATSQNMTPWVNSTGLTVWGVSGASATEVWLMGTQSELLIKQ